jgi:hypothetical protein
MLPRLVLLPRGTMLICSAQARWPSTSAQTSAGSRRRVALNLLADPQKEELAIHRGRLVRETVFWNA